MADFPAMPLWTDAYLADTRHLTAAEHGAYLLLMVEAWRRPSCSLPDDDRLLSRLACMSDEEWEASKPVVMAFWKLDRRAQTWSQKRLLKEHEYLKGKRAKNREAAAKRWKSTEKNDANAMQTDMRKASQPTPTPIPLKKEPSVQKKGTRIPDDFSPDLDIAVDMGLQPQQAISEAAKFVDYWRAKTGKDATKLDWVATWRNWIRSALDRQRTRGSPSQGRSSAFREHQDEVTRNLERQINGTGNRHDERQPAFDLDLDRTAYSSGRSTSRRE